MKDSGGPAFPTQPNTSLNPGMSLRDWFAGMAMEGMNASPALLEAVTSGEAMTGTHLSRMAAMAYRQADAMLKEREKDLK